ncbi:hypothetical protein V6Z12_A13G079600 [Gossypium hirsutum]
MPLQPRIFLQRNSAPPWPRHGPLHLPLFLHGERISASLMFLIW